MSLCRRQFLAASAGCLLGNSPSLAPVVARSPDHATTGPAVVAWSPDHATTEPGLLNPRVLLAACGGDAVILEKICQAFRARLPDHVAAVQDALRERDAMRLREAAHKICGMVAAFSTAAGAVASDLEDHAAGGRLEEAQPLVGRLETMAQELMREVDGLSLETLRQRTGPADDPSRTAGA